MSFHLNKNIYLNIPKNFWEIFCSIENFCRNNLKFFFKLHNYNINKSYLFFNTIINFNYFFCFLINF